MSSQPTRPTAAPRPGPRPTPAATAAIDPIKVIKKYMWLLAASVVVGAVIGVAGYFVLLKFAPRYRSSVFFQCYPPLVNPDKAHEAQPSHEDEMDRFMETQVRLMTSDEILDGVINDPKLRTEAAKWCAQFGRGARFDENAALLDLEEIVSAHVVRGTTVIELAVSWSDPVDVTAIAGLVKTRYITELERGYNRNILDQRDKLASMINAQKTQVQQTQARRDRILVDEGVDSLDTNLQQSTLELQQTTQELTNVRMDIEAVQVALAGLEQQLEAPGGIVYPDELRAQADQDRLIAGLRQQIASTEAEITRKRNAGYGPDHREVKRLRHQLDSLRQHLTEKTERTLRSLFDAKVDSTRRSLSQLRAQEADLLDRREKAESRNNELTRTKVTINDINREIEQLLQRIEQYESSLAMIDTQRSIETAARVDILQPERKPKDLAFPKIYIIGPAGVVLISGLVTAAVFLRELLDQRVRGASDLTLIPRARLVGVIPDASEDPSEPEQVETVFRDSPRGVLAESFRQLRVPLLKMMNHAGHKTLLVVSSMPESGVTSVVVNLAHSLAAGERRVLIIDANLRRPAVHRVLGLQDRPGLGEVLAGQARLDEVVSHSGTVDVLPAGAPELRLYERLGADSMSELLAEAKARYDVVLIDVSPAVVSGDAGILASKCDATVLVARALREKRGMVGRIGGELADARSEFLGVIINGVKSAAGGYLRRNIRATHEYETGSRDAAQPAA